MPSGRQTSTTVAILHRFATDESSAEALCEGGILALRIHDYRSGKQRGLLDALGRALDLQPTCHQGLDDNLAELQRNATEFREADETI